MERVEQDGLAFYRSSRWYNLKHGIFTRQGGTSQAPFDSLNLGGNVGDDPRSVRHNHERMYAALGVDDRAACTVWQVHGNDVIIAHAPVKGRRWLAFADAMVTDKADTALSMRFADCVPILFFDPVRGVIGMAHAGWRGLTAGVASNTVHTMTRGYGCKADDIQALIGPSIGPEHYQVGEDVVHAVHSYFGTLDGLIRRSEADGSTFLDLWAASALDLRRAGVEQIETAAICTASNTNEFFSHRGERGRTGRFGAVMSL